MTAAVPQPHPPHIATQDGPPPRLVLMADDVTGACDSAVHFARCGQPARLLLRHYAEPASVTALCIATRNYSAVQATAAFMESFRALPALGRRVIDVTLNVSDFAGQCNQISLPGLFSADTVFVRGLRGDFDLIVAMYHDQGHIPMKLIDFESTVNVSLGIPIIRTSVDHGTAFDIAGKNLADPRNMLAAMRLAARMATGKLTAAGAS